MAVEIRQVRKKDFNKILQYAGLGMGVKKANWSIFIQIRAVPINSMTKEDLQENLKKILF